MKNSINVDYLKTINNCYEACLNSNNIGDTDLKKAGEYPYFDRITSKVSFIWIANHKVKKKGFL